MTTKPSVGLALKKVAWIAPGAALAATLAFGAPGGAITPVMAQEATPVVSEAAQAPATVSVSGQGMVNVPPDTAQVTVGIDVIRQDLAEAQAEANRQATAIIEAVRSQGV